MVGQSRFADSPVADTGSGAAPVVDMGAFQLLNSSLIPLVIDQ
jgi:hypothetical protein